MQAIQDMATRHNYGLEIEGDSAKVIYLNELLKYFQVTFL
jgi:hypothetical protein